MRTQVAGPLLAVVLAGVLVYAYARWPGAAPSARPAPASRPAEPVVGATPAPDVSETPPAGPRVEFREAEPTSRPPAARPQARRRPADAAGVAAPRSGTAPGAKVRIRPSAPRLTDYFETVSAEIGGRWQVPEAADRRAAGVPVVLKIARDGRVIWALVEGSSGDSAIDGSVAGLIEDLKRDGLPPLPDDYPYDELDIGLVLNAAAAR